MLGGHEDASLCQATANTGLSYGLLHRGPAVQNCCLCEMVGSLISSGEMSARCQNAGPNSSGGKSAHAAQGRLALALVLGASRLVATAGRAGLGLSAALNCAQIGSLVACKVKLEPMGGPGSVGQARRFEELARLSRRSERLSPNTRRRRPIDPACCYS